MFTHAGYVFFLWTQNIGTSFKFRKFQVHVEYTKLERLLKDFKYIIFMADYKKRGTNHTEGRNDHGTGCCPDIARSAHEKTQETESCQLCNGR